MDTRPLAELEDLDGYRRLFADAAFWAPYAREVCRRHGLAPAEPVRIGIPGTCPAPIVAEKWVVKFFGRLFGGGKSFAAEQEAARLVQGSGLPVPAVHASGALDPTGDWPWPYLVFDFVRSCSFGEVFDELSMDDRLRAAGEMGDFARRLQALPLEGSPVFPNDHGAYLGFLQRQRAGCAERHREYGTLPDPLIRQIDAFLPPPEALVDFARPPHLIHADLTGDHLLGRVEDGRWTSLVLIDFGDAMTGDLLYELGPLQMDMFHGDTRLLAAFLDAYGLPADQRADLPRRALATALLHEFNLFASLAPPYTQANTLDELAQLLFAA